MDLVIIRYSTLCWWEIMANQNASVSVSPLFLDVLWQYLVKLIGQVTTDGNVVRYSMDIRKPRLARIWHLHEVPFTYSSLIHIKKLFSNCKLSSLMHMIIMCQIKEYLFPSRTCLMMIWSLSINTYIFSYFYVLKRRTTGALGCDRLVDGINFSLKNEEPRSWPPKYIYK